MALTKPAGCFLQILGLGLLLGACSVFVSQDATGPIISIPGLVLFVLGCLLLWVGRKPAVDG